METVKIKKDHVKTAWENADASGKKLLEFLFPDQIQLSPMERIKTIDDILADHNIQVKHWLETTSNLPKDEIAYKLLKMLAESLNEGWKPNWDDISEYKYYPWFDMRGSAGFRYHDYGNWAANTAVGSRLCFKSSELAEYAGTQFTELYKDFMIIN